MVSSTAATVDEYLAALPEARRVALAAIRDTVNANLPAGYEEGMQYGMISWHIPLSRYPTTYNRQPLGTAALASQKNHMALYVCVYMDATIDRWFRKAYADAGKTLDMGKSCVRFKQLDDVPLAVVGELIAKVTVEKLLGFYEEVHGAPGAKAKTKPRATKPRTTARAKRKSKSESKLKTTTKKKQATTTRAKPKSKSKTTKSKTKK